ncbi:MAG TPA: hypothetical protein VK579_04890 [Terriglobales bacterium]|nr:hypothetical protein [Terriglobales bacterium]
MAPTRSFWTWVGVAAALLLCTVFFFADHIGILLETLRNYLMIPGVMLAFLLPLHGEEGGRGWGFLMVAMIINGLFYSVILLAIALGFRKWRRTARAVNPSK